MSRLPIQPNYFFLFRARIDGWGEGLIYCSVTGGYVCVQEKVGGGYCSCPCEEGLAKASLQFALSHASQGMVLFTLVSKMDVVLKCQLLM